MILDWNCDGKIDAIDIGTSMAFMEELELEEMKKRISLKLNTEEEEPSDEEEYL